MFLFKYHSILFIDLSIYLSLFLIKALDTKLYSYFNQTHKNQHILKQKTTKHSHNNQVTIKINNLFHSVTQKMYRNKMIKFGIQIRWENRTSKLNQLRNQLRHTQQIDYYIDKLLHLSVNKQNYSAIKEILNQINTNIIQLSSPIMPPQKNIKMEKQYHQQSNQSQESYNNQQSQYQYWLKHQQLLKSLQFKRYLVQILESMNWINTKSFRKLTQQQTQLLTQILTLIGLIMNQPYFLRSYFQLTGSRQQLSNKQSNQSQYYQHQNQSGGTQQTIIPYDNNQDEMRELSFQLTQQIIFYLKYQLSTMDSLLSQPNTFLTLLHSLTRIIQHFTFNSLTQSSNKNQTNILNQKDDSQSLHYLYQLLNSNTFQKYLKQLMIDVIDSEKQYKTGGNNDQKKQSSEREKVVVIKVSMLQIIGAYVYLMQRVNPHLQLSKTFLSTLQRFSSHSLQLLHHINVQRYLSLLEKEKEQEQEINFNSEVSDINQLTKNSQLLCLRMLFSLHDIISHPQIEFNYQLSLLVCYELMLFLHNTNNRFCQSQVLQTRKNKKHLRCTMVQEGKLKTIQQINPTLYYLDILVDQQENIWFTQFELIGCLYNLVSSFNITLEQLFNFNIHQHQYQYSHQHSYSISYLSNLSILIFIDTKFILSLFQTVCQSILRLSGTFFNQRHLFMTTTVYLFCCWYQDIQNESNKKKKTYLMSKQKQFSIEFMINLAQIIINNLQQLKSDILTNKQILKIPITLHLNANSTSSVLIQNQSILSTLTYLEEVLQEIIHPIGLQNNEIEI